MPPTGFSNPEVAFSQGAQDGIFQWARVGQWPTWQINAE
jgi:hypothetical protein